MNSDYNINMPGRIVSYDPVEQLSVVMISNSKNYSNSDVTNRQVSRVKLVDVPTFTPGGGGWHMTFPIKPGDTCLLSFSQFGYDHWLFEDKDAAGVRLDGQPFPWTERKFSLRDGFAQVGWNNIPRAVADYSANHSQWRNVDASQVISLNEDTSITITSPIALTINAPEVTVICETSEVIASTSTTITCPANTIDGDLEVTGTITAPNMSATTALTSPSVVAGGINMQTHDHAGDGGTGSTTTTGGPRNV